MEITNTAFLSPINWISAYCFSEIQLLLFLCFQQHPRRDTLISSLFTLYSASRFHARDSFLRNQHQACEVTHTGTIDWEMLPPSKFCQSLRKARSYGKHYQLRSLHPAHSSLRRMISFDKRIKSVDLCSISLLDCIRYSFFQADCFIHYLKIGKM